MILTQADLVALTGYRRGAEQVRWLTRNGIAHYVTRSGRPAVTWDAISGTQAQREPRPPAEARSEGAELLLRLQQAANLDSARPGSRPRKAALGRT